MATDTAADTDEVRVRDALDRIVQCAQACFGPLKIILFGSQATGRAHEESDIDILVIAESELRPAQRSAALALACHPLGFPMDVIVRTPDEVRERLAMGDSFLARILDEGRVLYERP